ncbi:MAG: hypothetical protein GY802_28430 [Gammaproteobacteria bacterium]|nr:hypothetical protein [Gammaproteobacteria bacterium]
MPDFFVTEHISDGRLVRLLPDLKLPEFGMYLVYPQSRRLPSKTRAFIDFTVKSLKTAGTSLDTKADMARQVGG